MLHKPMLKGILLNVIRSKKKIMWSIKYVTLQKTISKEEVWYTGSQSTNSNP